MKWFLIILILCLLIAGGFFFLKSQQTHPAPAPQTVNQSNSIAPDQSSAPNATSNGLTATNTPSVATSPSGTTAPTPKSGTVHVTKTDNESTIYVTVGTTLILDYKSSDYQWGDVFDSSFIQTISPTEVKVLKPGTAVLHSEGQPNCTSNAPCPSDYPTVSIRVIIS